MFKRHHFHALAALFLIATPPALSAEEDIAASAITTLPTELKYSFNWWQPMIGAKTAYSKGQRGAGVIVGVLDTGINTNNPEFKGRLRPGYNAINNTSNAMDDNGHGTHVAGILGASADTGLTVGIAPLVSLMPIKVLNAAGTGTEASFTAGVQYSIRYGARVLNMSLGASSPFGQAAMQQAVTAGQLAVVAAGNSAAANPDYPAQYAKESWAKKQIIAVGAVDKTGKIAAYSNRAGNTANFFVVAPGSTIASTYGANQYAYMSGTSMATPMVAGVAADILNYWTYLRADQVSSIIFQTATHMGTTKVGVADPVYGWGMVNLTKALQPIGATTLTLANSSVRPVSRSVVYTNALVKASAFSGLAMTATDDFGRAYTYDLEQFAIKPASADLASLFGRMDKQMSLVERTTPNANLTLSLYGNARATEPVTLLSAEAEASAITLGGFNYVQKFAGSEYVLGTNGFADHYFGLSADYKALPLTNSFANPYFQLAGTASHFGAGYTLADGLKLKVGLLDSLSPLASQYPYGDAQSATGWISELEKKFTGGTVRLTAGAVKEDGSVLGATGSSAFELSGAETNYLSVSGAHALTAKDALLWQVSTGNTESGGDALITASAAKTLSWSLGLLHTDAWLDGDMLAVAVSQPMKVMSGNMTLALPTVDENGAGDLEFTQVDMASDLSETDFEVGYMAPLSKSSSIHFNAAYKQHVGNSADDAAVVGLRFRTSF